MVYTTRFCSSFCKIIQQKWEIQSTPQTRLISFHIHWGPTYSPSGWNSRAIEGPHDIDRPVSSRALHVPFQPFSRHIEYRISPPKGPGPPFCARAVNKIWYTPAGQTTFITRADLSPLCRIEFCSRAGDDDMWKWKNANAYFIMWGIGTNARCFGNTRLIYVGVYWIGVYYKPMKTFRFYW